MGVRKYSEVAIDKLVRSMTLIHYPMTSLWLFDGSVKLCDNRSALFKLSYIYAIPYSREADESICVIDSTQSRLCF